MGARFLLRPNNLISNAPQHRFASRPTSTVLRLLVGDEYAVNLFIVFHFFAPSTRRNPDPLNAHVNHSPRHSVFTLLRYLLLYTVDINLIVVRRCRRNNDMQYGQPHLPKWGSTDEARLAGNGEAAIGDPKIVPRRHRRGCIGEPLFSVVCRGSRSEDRAFACLADVPATDRAARHRTRSPADIRDRGREPPWLI